MVSRERARQFDPDNAVDMLTASNETIQLQRVVNDDGTEVRLYCHSIGRDTKGDRDRGTLRDPVRDRSRQPRRWSEQATHTGKLSDIQQRIGRLKEKSRRIGQHYEITVTSDETGTKAGLPSARTKTPVEGSMLTHPGVYCLRSNETTWRRRSCGAPIPC